MQTAADTAQAIIRQELKEGRERRRLGLSPLPLDQNDLGGMQCCLVFPDVEECAAVSRSTLKPLA